MGFMDSYNPFAEKNPEEHTSPFISPLSSNQETGQSNFFTRVLFLGTGLDHLRNFPSQGIH